MLNNKDKKYLRKLSMSYRPLFQIGKDGISYNLIKTISDSLELMSLSNAICYRHVQLIQEKRLLSAPAILIVRSYTL